ncbi:hypothetical protein L195_g020149 [Trifolium pratense]|uniref:Uncharacterized protein n=1 Tax=Trifolium pratense TaxID=57577 RepID=A0A2K3N1N6_TRIPR|nr:hypothetical protein L195_g020149 [Trifolium pratense]
MRILPLHQSSSPLHSHQPLSSPAPTTLPIATFIATAPQSSSRMLWFWLICQQKLLHDVMVSPPWRTAMVKDRENWFVLARTLLLVLMV